MSDSQPQRVKIKEGDLKGKEGTLDGHSMLLHAYRVQIDGYSFASMFPEHYVEFIPRPEPSEWR